MDTSTMRKVVMFPVAAATVAALVLAAAGCGGGGGTSESAGTFIARILREEISGQWAAQWRELHPGHQALITRAQYVLCSQAMGTDFGTGKEKFDVQSIRDVALHVRGVPEHTSKLVTIRLSNAKGVPPTTYRLHAVLDHGHWTWILGASFLEAIGHGQCLDGSPLSPSA